MSLPSHYAIYKAQNIEDVNQAWPDLQKVIKNREDLPQNLNVGPVCRIQIDTIGYEQETVSQSTVTYLTVFHLYEKATPDAESDKVQRASDLIQKLMVRRNYIDGAYMPQIHEVKLNDEDVVDLKEGMMCTRIVFSVNCRVETIIST